MSIHKFLAEIEEQLYSVYKHIHENPELSLDEHNTKAFIEQEINSQVHCDQLISIGPTGLVAVLHGTKEGTASEEVLLLRGDMDALPIHEDPTHEPRSKNDGIMHACGHDSHTTMLLGALRVLSRYKAHFSGTIYFFFQPAEEVLGGAKLFLETDKLDLNKIKGAAACHVIPDLYAGDVGLKSGAMLASADEFEIKIIGKGGHAAHPYTTVDPVVIAAEVIVNLQNLVSREVNALDSAVVSVCSIHSEGYAFNIIPDYVTLKGTLRTIKKATRKQLKKRIFEVSEGIANTHRAATEIEYKDGPPHLHNDDDWVAKATSSFVKLLGEECIKALDVATMGAEDFAFILDRFPGIFVRIGCRSEGKEFTPIHSSRFTVDRKAITTGVLAFCGIAFDFFGVDEKIWT